MFASQSRALRSTAQRTATALAHYERHVRHLVTTWLDMELYRMVSDEIDEIREFCAVLPQVALSWTALLVSHADLIHALWRSTHRVADAAEVDASLREHLECIAALSQRCQALAEAATPTAA